MEETNEDGIEGVQYKGKEIVHSNTMFGNDWRESPPQVYSDSLLGLDLNKHSMNEPPLINSHLNHGNDMIEELTLKTNENPIPNPIPISNSSVVVVGSSNTSVRERMQTSRQGHWNHLYQLAGGLGSGASHCENVSKDKELDLGVMGNSFIPEFGTQKQLQQSIPQSSEMLRRFENGSESPSGIRTKLLTSSRFPQFLVKNSLKGKAVVRKPHDEFVGGVAIEQTNEKVGHGVAGIEQKGVSVSRVVSDPAADLGLKVNNLPRRTVECAATATDGILLREWLKPGHKVNRNENMRIFRQIVELVDIAHSEQVDLQYVRPSAFKLLPSNHVKYVGSSFVERDSFGSGIDTEVTSMANRSSRKRAQKEGCPPTTSLNSKQHKLFKSMNFTRQQFQFSAGSGYKCESGKEVDMNDVGSQDSGYDTSQSHHLNSEHRIGNRFGIPVNTTPYQFTAAKFQLEEKWYTTPEEHNRRERTIFSDIYCLGVLLFELFCCHESWEVHTAAMLNLRHRILPPKFLSEYPKEAGFCLWLLHPEPSSRPRARDILNSELICESREVSEGRLPLPVEEDHTESELLLHFLSTLKEIKRKRASKLVDEIKGIEADLKEVEKRHLLRTTGNLLSNTREVLLKEPPPSQARLMKNMSQLESAYFSMRSQIQLSDTDRTSRSDKDLLRSRESWSQVQNEGEGNLKPTDHLGAFFDGLCKYARYSKFELRGTLRNGDLLNSANVICSLSFDRDEEYFAAAGVAKKIKIFEFQGLLNNSVDIHYPVVEMTSKSKLSCVCWNNYIKNYLAATDYDGVVQLWDASTGQGFSQYIEHDKRAWSVDFSRVDPTKLASGSDDCSVKLWNINERKSISTIRSAANVCCVQFSAHSTHLLALGSADYKTYCYDLRNTRSPWCTLAGHGKAVSYVKFLDSETLVSASTDNTLKLWDLNKTSCSGLSTDSCSLTFRGHTNEKNFVGLSVSDGYITCGSESNEVYAYHRSLPMPITSHKFGSLDPISGQENADDCGQFVSSVCWKGKSDMVIAANSSGSIKLLQMM